MRSDGVLLQLDEGLCAELFATRSRTALKFLAALNAGLIKALRGADRRLMRAQGGAGDGYDALAMAALATAIPATVSV